MPGVAIPTFSDPRMNDAFKSIFGASKFHSEQDRQEAIGKKADSIAKDITAALLNDDSEAIEIAGDMLGFMEPEAMARLIRYALRNDVGHLRLELLAAMDDSVKRTADLRAVRQAEAEAQE